MQNSAIFLLNLQMPVLLFSRQIPFEIGSVILVMPYCGPENDRNIRFTNIHSSHPAARSYIYPDLEINE